MLAKPYYDVFRNQYDNLKFKNLLKCAAPPVLLVFKTGGAAICFELFGFDDAVILNVEGF